MNDRQVKYKLNESTAVWQNSQYLWNIIVLKKKHYFEFCWSSLADEHNTSPKSTKRNVKLNKFAFGTQWMSRIYNVNIDLCHQYGFSITKSQTFLLTKHCQWKGARRLIPPLVINFVYLVQCNLKFQQKPCHIQMTSWPVSANISLTNSFFFF